MKQYVAAFVIAVLASASTTFAAPTPQQRCDYLRITAARKYRSCIENGQARYALNAGFGFDEFAAFARCRHTYFEKWEGFQANASLAGSSCVGNRFADNGDQTVIDNLTALIWEKKTNRDGVANYPADPHDADNEFSWGFASGIEDGGLFDQFLRDVNGGSGFAGSNGWRVPTLAELQTILLDFPCRGPGGEQACSCPAVPCIAPTLDPTNTSTFASDWTSTTSRVTFPEKAWQVAFSDGLIVEGSKTAGGQARAVRGGL